MLTVSTISAVIWDEKKSDLPTTCISTYPVRVENVESAVTSHEKLPDSPNPTFRRTTWLAFEDNVCWKHTKSYLCVGAQTSK